MNISQLSSEEREALTVIAQCNHLLQPTFSPHIKKRLLDAGLVRETLGSTLQATDKGLATVISK